MFDIASSLAGATVSARLPGLAFLATLPICGVRPAALIPTI
ncbi:MAG TPA: hypothetical protein VMW65_05680 [Chloroflexota bacterium]|nr:hypothetical protein [Chloroflexota bacterium]